VAMW